MTSPAAHHHLRAVPDASPGCGGPVEIDLPPPGTAWFQAGAKVQGAFFKTVAAHHLHSAGPVRVVGSPVRFSSTPSSVRSVPPELGQHTAEILRDVLDMSEDDIAGASERGAFGRARPVPAA